MEIHFKIIGILLLFLAVIHIFFPRYFNWKKELQSLSLINKQMMFVHTFFIAFVIFLMGLLCISSSSDLIHTPLGKTISFGLGIFWFVRLIFQLCVYSSLLWKGKPFETTIHILFLFLWSYLSAVFFCTALY